MTTIKDIRINDIGKTIRYVGRNGIIPAMYAARERLAHRFGQQYQYEPPSEEDLETQRRDWKRLQDGEEPEEKASEEEKIRRKEQTEKPISNSEFCIRWN